MTTSSMTTASTRPDFKSESANTLSEYSEIDLSSEWIGLAFRASEAEDSACNPIAFTDRSSKLVIAESANVATT